MLEDDLHGGPAEETVIFALDGVQYEMDLSAANAAGLRELFAPYVGPGRRIGAQSVATDRRLGGGGPARTDREQLAVMRAWARARGLEVNDRGRIPRHIVEAYNSGVTALAVPAVVAPSARRRPRKSGWQRARARGVPRGQGTPG